MPELLVEIGCEELPSSACRELIDQVPGIVEASLDAHGLSRDAVQVWVAPRRFAVSVTGLPERQSGEAKSVSGPPATAAFDAEGKPTKAAEGFARKQGVAVEDLVIRAGRDGRDVVFAEVAGEARQVGELVPEIAKRLIEGIRFGKTMRWGEGTGLRFSRPIRWIVAKLDDRTIPFELHGLTAGDVSRGHRFIGGPATIATAADYREAVRGVGVVADHVERRATITAALDAAAHERGCVWRDPLGKIEEVVHLVEWPSLIVGTIQDQHMRLPPKVLVTAMQSHQRYFPLEREDGSLYPEFLAISNGDPKFAAIITKGNEEVLSARLQDATFSVRKDEAVGLDQLNEKLDTIVFHQRLGSLANKRDRLKAGVRFLGEKVGAAEADIAVAGDAAKYSKADQASILVAEFAELQGYAGAYYAQAPALGLGDGVRQAIAQQYLPQGPDTPLPSELASSLLASADKIDTLAGAFAIREVPTSSKDPYGLRRAAAGLVRIFLDRQWDVGLWAIVSRSRSSLQEHGVGLSSMGDLWPGLRKFLVDRLAFQLSVLGIDAESFAAAEAAALRSIELSADMDVPYEQSTEMDLNLVATAIWAKELDSLRSTTAFQTVFEASNRLSRIHKQGPEHPPVWSESEKSEPAELALNVAIQHVRPLIGQARHDRDFGQALREGETLAAAVEAFFTDVLINVEDQGLRGQRYGLVRDASLVFTKIADFSAITKGSTR